MPEYLATARNAEGKKVTERVDVGSADEALAVLRARGYEEIVLHTDDVGARYTRQSAVASVISPREYMWFRDLPTPVAGFLLHVIKGYKASAAAHLAALAVLGFRVYRTRRWDWIDSGLAGYLLLPLVFAAASQLFRGAGGRYNRLIEAVSWGRWEEVLAAANHVGGGVPREEIAFQKAKALAGLGRLDEGLRLVEPFRDERRLPGWAYWSRLAGVYSAAKRRDDSKAAMETALELAPGNATLLVDMADSEVWLRRNPRRARELLALARRHALSDMVQVFVMHTEGLIRLEEGDAREARALLEEAFRKTNAFRHASPLMGLILDKLRLSLAFACAAEGDTAAAVKHYRLARPRLLALGYDDQLARCAQAVGLPQGE